MATLSGRVRTDPDRRIRNTSVGVTAYPPGEAPAPGEPYSTRRGEAIYSSIHARRFALHIPDGEKRLIRFEPPYKPVGTRNHTAIARKDIEWTAIPGGEQLEIVIPISDG